MVCSCSLHKYLTVIRMPQIFSNTDPCQDMLRFSNPSEPFQWNRAGRQQKDWKTQGTLQLCTCTIHQSCSHFDHRRPQKIVEVHSRFTFGKPMTLNWGFYFFKKKKKDQLCVLFQEVGHRSWEYFTHALALVFQKRGCGTWRGLRTFRNTSAEN